MGLVTEVSRDHQDPLLGFEIGNCGLKRALDLRPLPRPKAVGKILALPNNRASIQTSHENVEPAVASCSFNMFDLQAGMPFLDQLTNKPLERVPIKFPKALVKRMHEGIFSGVAAQRQPFLSL